MPRHERQGKVMDRIYVIDKIWGGGVCGRFLRDRKDSRPLFRAHVVSAIDMHLMDTDGKPEGIVIGRAKCGVD